MNFSNKWSLFLFLCVALVFAKDCEDVMDCEDDEGRTVCWSHYCFRDVPCNKDDDCYFYGSLHMLRNPRFLCYVLPVVRRPAGYGTCVEQSYGERNYEKFTQEMADEVAG